MPVSSCLDASTPGPLDALPSPDASALLAAFLSAEQPLTVLADALNLPLDGLLPLLRRHDLPALLDLADRLSRRRAIAALERILAETDDPTERRHAATTLLRATQSRENTSDRSAAKGPARPAPERPNDADRSPAGDDAARDAGRNPPPPAAALSTTSTPSPTAPGGPESAPLPSLPTPHLEDECRLEFSWHSTPYTRFALTLGGIHFGGLPLHGDHSRTGMLAGLARLRTAWLRILSSAAPGDAFLLPFALRTGTRDPGLLALRAEHDTPDTLILRPALIRPRDLPPDIDPEHPATIPETLPISVPHHVRINRRYHRHRVLAALDSG